MALSLSLSFIITIRPTYSTTLHKFNNPHLKWGTHHYPLPKTLTFVCSAEKPRKKGKGSRAIRSNEEICSELREFILGLGLPEDHVPSVKELSEHGRKDLAYIVRRRGYKIITELLRNSCKIDSNSDMPSLANFNSNACRDGASEVQEASDVENGEMPSESDLKDDAISSDSTPDSAYLASQDDSLLAQHTDRDHSISDQGLERAHNVGSIDLDKSGKRDRTEIDNLKAMLNHKVTKLLELKGQIEKEKQALCILQEKAYEEINNAQKMLMGKDMELCAAEENLSGLKEVHIVYQGVGETVEIAGSFNGWHHRFNMDPQPSSHLINPYCCSYLDDLEKLEESQAESLPYRNLKVWSTILWMYPGIYEIKFIVDGIWRIDPNREITTQGNITNNILRVEK